MEKTKCWHLLGKYQTETTKVFIYFSYLEHLTQKKIIEFNLTYFPSTDCK